jgi:hypothetical protein
MTTDSESTLKPFSSARLALRSAAVFGVVGTAGFALFAIFARDNPLRSQDPYIFGMLCGTPAATAAAFYTMFETFVRRPIVIDFLYFGLLTMWSLMLWLYGFVAPEGQRLGLFLAGGSMAAGTIGWPLCRFRIPRKIEILAAVVGVLLVATYAVVGSRIG